MLRNKLAELLMLRTEALERLEHLERLERLEPFLILEGLYQLPQPILCRLQNRYAIPNQ
jgi:hypothetical protein